MIPEREVPGLRANAWAAPMSTASRVVQVVDRADTRHSVGDAEQQTAEDQRDGDDCRGAEILVDLILEQRPDSGRRHRRQQQQPGDPTIGIAAAGRPQRAPDPAAM